MTERFNEEQQHHKALQLFHQAELAVRDNDLGLAKRLNIEAGRVSENLFNRISADRLRTKAIIGTQAITGYWRAEDWPDVLRLSPIVLTEIDPQNEYHKIHIKEMLTYAQNETPVDPLTWARFSRITR